MADILIDRLYIVLQDIEEFKELSMDRQGELCYEFARKIEGCIEVEKVVYKNKKM